jgi:uncharacterized membrane protein HdeD (DUF308 family)
MSSMLQEAEQTAATQLTKLRWALGLNGLLAIAFGVAIIVWPDISLHALVLVFGIYALVSGIFGLVMAFSSPIAQGRGWLIVSSIAGIAVGVIVFFYTDMSALALLYVIGAYAIALGLVTIGGAFWLPLSGSDSVLIAVAGLISILFGIVMFAKPGDGAVAVLALIAAYAIIVGVVELTAAIGGERLYKRALQQLTTTARPQASH